MTEAGTRAIPLFTATLAIFCLGMLTTAQGQSALSSEEIKDALTNIRAVGVRPKINDDGYAVPEASNYVSLRTIQFDLDRASLRPEAMAQLNEVAKALQAPDLAGARISIEGHTCDLGTPQHNQQLSEARGQSVVQYLEQQGVAANRLSLKAWGETRPVAPNASDQDRERNRRVDFVRLEDASKPDVTRGLRKPTPVPSGTRAIKTSRFVDVKFLGMKRGTESGFDLAPEGSALASGDMFQIQVLVKEGCHLYVVFRSSDGSIQWLHPVDGGKYGVWTYFGDQFTLPEGNKWFVLDNNPGTEVLCVVATSAPLGDLTPILDALQDLGSGATDALIAKLPKDDEAQAVRLVLLHE